jgi:hypothetical protein
MPLRWRHRASVTLSRVYVKRRLRTRPLRTRPRLTRDATPGRDQQRHWNRRAAAEHRRRPGQRPTRRRNLVDWDVDPLPEGQPPTRRRNFLEWDVDHVFSTLLGIDAHRRHGARRGRLRASPACRQGMRGTARIALPRHGIARAGRDMRRPAPAGQTVPLPASTPSEPVTPGPPPRDGAPTWRSQLALPQRRRCPRAASARRSADMALPAPFPGGAVAPGAASPRWRLTKGSNNHTLRATTRPQATSTQGGP